MTPPRDDSGSLLRVTLELLKQCPLSYLDVHKRTGLPFYWLRKLGQGRMANPSVNKIQTLYEFLTDTKLDLAGK